LLVESNAEQRRLREHAERKKHWRRWGPYLSERQWGTVREDYSEDGDAWRFVTHDMARSYAYRWGEDGIGGISDNHQRLCLSIALWNGVDPILKERLFGLSNPEGNHGEDVKELYWYLDGTPTHSYLKYLYRYPIEPFPYAELVERNRQRDRSEPEFELADTGVFDGARYADVLIEYAKVDDEDIVGTVTVHNFSPKPERVHLIPLLWFRKDWSCSPGSPDPILKRSGDGAILATHSSLGTRRFAWEGTATPFFTDNETNMGRLFGSPNATPYTKDAFHRRIVEGETSAVRPDEGTRAAIHYVLDLAPDESRTIRFRLSDQTGDEEFDSATAQDVTQRRREEADAFYEQLHPPELPATLRNVQRQALAGMIWSQQWYHYSVDSWLRGDPGQPTPPETRWNGPNRNWTHLYCDDVLTMPDTWEYPWFAVWDTAFHALPLCLTNPEFAKRQLLLLTREWFMHPNGQLPAYEWSFSDVNPPVHAWAAHQVFRMQERRSGVRDLDFLESIYHKLLMNFTWWVNRKDIDDNNVFDGGFLGMDNIGVFDRSNPPPGLGKISQSDGTSWMAAYSLHMLSIAWELGKSRPAYESIASKFFEHFLHIAAAIQNVSRRGASLWHEQDGFFYDQIRFPDGTQEPLRIRSMVGLIPLLAVEILDYENLEQFGDFRKRMDWFFENRPDLTESVFCLFSPGEKQRCLLSLLNPEQLKRVLAVLFDEDEFLSPFGVRSLSKYHDQHPYTFSRDGFEATIRYEPGESQNGLFGGNSNWRGPIWFPINYILIDALKIYHEFWGDQFLVEFPTGSGNQVTLQEAARNLAMRLISLTGGSEDSPAGGENPQRLQFFEYFHAETGHGLGASHQTGWTALVANLIEEWCGNEL
jgi:hypothetical protein